MEMIPWTNRAPQRQSKPATKDAGEQEHRPDPLGEVVLAPYDQRVKGANNQQGRRADRDPLKVQLHKHHPGLIIPWAGRE